MVAIPAGDFRMGGADPDEVVGDGEGPVRTVHLRPYAIDATAVTNAQFATFVKATAYVTDAERAGWSAVFHLQIGPAARAAVMEAVLRDAPWWRAVRTVGSGKSSTSAGRSRSAKTDRCSPCSTRSCLGSG